MFTFEIPLEQALKWSREGLPARPFGLFVSRMAVQRACEFAIREKRDGWVRGG